MPPFIGKLLKKLDAVLEIHKCVLLITDIERIQPKRLFTELSINLYFKLCVCAV